MKKALAMALGAVLVAGSAAPASAASQVDFSGYYRAHYAVNGNLGYTGGDNANLNESFFGQRLNINVTFQATDEVSVYWRFRTPAGGRWGEDASNGGFTSMYYYGQVVQDWGTVRVGRIVGTNADEFGLSTLGWAPALDDFATLIAPFEGSGNYDSIQYTNSWDNGFGLTATYSRVTDQRFGAWVEANGSDNNADRFQIQPTYQWDTGGVALNTYYVRDASPNGNSLGRAGGTYALNLTTGDVDFTEGTGNPSMTGREDKSSVWYINPAFMQSWGAFSTHFEGMFAFGKTQYYNEGLTQAEIDNDFYMEDSDADGMGFYLDFDYNYGPGRVNLAGWWVDGNDIDDFNKDGVDMENNALADIVNGNFYPLVVAYSPVNAYYAGTSTDDRRGTVGAVGVANNGGSFISNTTLLNVSAVGALIGGGVTGITVGDGVTAGNQLANGRTGARGFYGALDRGQGSLNSNGNSNHWALMVSGQHAFTDEITFNYALAYMALVNPNYRVVESGSYVKTRNGANTNDDYAASYSNQDTDLGWEIDLGVNVQLLDNLAFTSTIGYMFTGDAYKQLKGYRVSDASTVNTDDYNVRAEWEDADDAYTWINSLTFSF